MTMDAVSVITYYVKLVLAYANYYVFRLADIYKDFPYEIKVAVAIIMISVVLIFTFSFAMWRRRRGRKKVMKTRRRLQKQYGEAIDRVFAAAAEEMLSREEIASHIHRKKPTTDPKELLKNKQERRLFCQMVYGRLITDTTYDKPFANLHRLLDFFGVPGFLEEEVSLSRMHHKMKAMDMVRTFKLHVSPWVINKLLKDKRAYVRRQAMYSAISSSSDSDLNYFETSFFDMNSCVKDEIELGYVLRRRHQSGLKLPNLAHWANMQKDDDTKCIFVKLMRRFDQREYCSQLMDLFKESKHKRLTEEICCTWGYLKYDECEPLLGEILLTQPDETKVAILHAVTRLNTGKSLHLLLDGYENTSNPNVRFEALRCIYNYGDAGRSLFQKLEMSAGAEDETYFNFFHNALTRDRLRLDNEQSYCPAVETVYNQVN